MTCERADDKCERCGIGLVFGGKVDFTDELLCPNCKDSYTPHTVEEYIMDEPEY